MAVIKIKCSKCQHETRIDVKTIDTLRTELKKVTSERDEYRAKLAALKVKFQHNPMGGIFGDLFRGV